MPPEELQLRYEVKRNPDVGFHVTFYPTNLGIEQEVHHGIDVSNLSDIAEYLPIAREQMLLALEQSFPGAYK